MYIFSSTARDLFSTVDVIVDTGVVAGVVYLKTDPALFGMTLLKPPRKTNSIKLLSTGVHTATNPGFQYVEVYSDCSI